MIFKPEWLNTPEYVTEEIRRCQERVEPGIFDTGLIVDANNTMYRLAFAASKDCNDELDMFAVFLNRVRTVAREIGADLVVCCIDYGKPLRQTILGATKKPDKTPEQEKVIELARAALKLLRAGDPKNTWLNPRFLDGYEADDLCAAIAVSGLCVHTVLYSTDSDLYQVTDGSGVVQMSPATGKFLKSEVPPELVAAVKALAGDSSDNVQGIHKVGPVTALAVLRGEKELDLSREDTARVRNNLTLTTLPFPGAFRALDAGSLVRCPATFGEAVQTDDEESGELPF